MPLPCGSARARAAAYIQNWHRPIPFLLVLLIALIFIDLALVAARGRAATALNALIVVCLADLCMGLRHSHHFALQHVAAITLLRTSLRKHLGFMCRAGGGFDRLSA
jgi:hypothetical protein